MSEIALLLDEPYHVLRRKMKKMNIYVRQKYSNLSQRRLARIVGEMLEENWRLGKNFSLFSVVYCIKVLLYRSMLPQYQLLLYDVSMT